MKKDTRRSVIFLVVVTLLCVLMGFMPAAYPARMPANATREKARVISVDNSQIAPLGIVYSGTQEAYVEILSGDFKGLKVAATNSLNAALEKDKLFAAGDQALIMLHSKDGVPTYASLIDHYRMNTQFVLLLLFGLLLAALAGIAGCGALLSLIASVLVIWKVQIPLLLMGYSPIPAALGIVALLTLMIMYLVAGFTKRATAAFLGSMLGTLLTCVLTLVFGSLLDLDGSSIPYAVPLITQAGLNLNLRELFFSMVFLGNSGALMDLAMDIASSCDEVRRHHPAISRKELIESGFSVARSVIGTMTTTLMLAYSGSYLSMLMYFIGQGTPVVDILNYKFVASEILTTLVGSFGLVTVAPFTAIVAGVMFVPHGKRAKHEGNIMS